MAEGTGKRTLDKASLSPEANQSKKASRRRISRERRGLHNWE